MLPEYNDLFFQSSLQSATNNCWPNKTSRHYHLDNVINPKVNYTSQLVKNVYEKLQI